MGLKVAYAKEMARHGNRPSKKDQPCDHRVGVGFELLNISLTSGQGRRARD